MIVTREVEEVALSVIEKVKDEKVEQINGLFADKYPYDMALIFQNIPERHRASMLHHLEESTLASLMLKLNPTHQLEVLSKIGPEKSNKVLSMLDTNFLSRLIKKFPKVDLQSYLEEIDPDRADYLREMIALP